MPLDSHIMPLEANICYLQLNYATKSSAYRVYRIYRIHGVLSIPAISGIPDTLYRVHRTNGTRNASGIPCIPGMLLYGVYRIRYMLNYAT